MAGWSRHEGQAAVLAMDNIDTDQLIPARFMATSRAEGYGDFLLHDLRGPGFALDAAPGASVLIAGRNFGCGSSREAAVYALVDAGFRVVVAPSFGDIFAANAVNNGLCPAQVADIAPLAAAAGRYARARVDLRAGRVRIGETEAPFALREIWRTKLIEGWDDIDLTRARDAAIADFAAARPRWTQPHRNKGTEGRA